MVRARGTFSNNFVWSERLKLIFTQVTECEDKGGSSLDWVQYKEKCYYTSQDSPIANYVSWQEAETFCKRNGGFLVSVHSLNELGFLASKVTLSAVI